MAKQPDTVGQMLAPTWPHRSVEPKPTIDHAATVPHAEVRSPPTSLGNESYQLLWTGSPPLMLPMAPHTP